MPSKYRKTSTSKKPHLLRAGGLAAEIGDLRDDLQAEVTGSLWTNQAAWAIDATLGKDTNIGTPAFPLKTMEEFNSRFDGLIYKGVGTVQLVGDVIDQPLWLRNTVFATGASLTIQGTATTILTTATISVVTSLNPAGATLQPWQLTTTGIDWTTVPLGSRLLLSNGSLGFIRNVIDANNVVCGAFATIASASVVPTAALTITVQALSRALPSNVTIQALDSAVLLTIRDLSFDTGNICCTAPSQNNVLIFGCEIKCATGTVITSVGGLKILGARFTMASGATTMSFRSAAGQVNAFTCVWSGATTGTVTANSTGHVQLQHTCILNAMLFAQGTGLFALNTSCNIQHTTTAVRLDTGGFINSGICQITGSAGSGIGIDVRCGTFIWNGAAAKPTITGASDCAVAGVGYTYAQLGTGKTASIVPVTAPATPVVNTDANRGPGIATMSQSG